MIWTYVISFKDAAIWRRPSRNGSGDLYSFTDSPAVKPGRKAGVAHTLEDVRQAILKGEALPPPYDVSEDPWAEYLVKYPRKLRIDTSRKTVRYYDKAAGVDRRGVILSRRRNRSRESLTLLLGEPIRGEEKTKKQKTDSRRKVSTEKAVAEKNGRKKTLGQEGKVRTLRT